MSLTIERRAAMNRFRFQAMWFTLSLSIAFSTHAAEQGFVSHVSVVSDKVPDVSSMEASKNAFIREGMSDREKGLAIWRSVVAFHHQDAPPNEMPAPCLEIEGATPQWNSCPGMGVFRVLYSFQAFSVGVSRNEAANVPMPTAKKTPPMT